jgi:phage tail-like protein
MADPGVAYVFQVVIDGILFGNFTQVSGLSAKYETETVKEGGENTHVHHLPGRMTYTNVTLQRPVDYGTMALSSWFSKFQKNLSKGSSNSRNNASIMAYGANHIPIAEWTLLDAVPVAYTGPKLGAGKSEILTESIELAHNGFWSLSSSVQGMTATTAVAAGAAVAIGLSAKRELDLVSRAGMPLGGL